jgi:cbb3-type cytochrome oxidase maturation protein
MESLYVLIPVTLVLLGIALAAWLWSVGSGQFDDLDKAANSILVRRSGQGCQQHPLRRRNTGEAARNSG